MINIAICDDIAEYINILTSLIKEYPSNIPIDIQSFTTGEALLDSIQNKDRKYDLIFMDVRLSENTTGIEIAKELKIFIPNTLMVYTSSYDNYYIDLVHTDSFGFIHKPFTTEKVNKVLDDAFLHMKAQHSQYSCSFNGVTNIIDLFDISYIYSEHRKIYFHNYKTNEEMCCYKKMDELVDELKNLCPLFEQVNKSYLVNMYKITNIGRNNVCIGDFSISVTENYRLNFHKKFFQVRNLYI